MRCSGWWWYWRYCGSGTWYGDSVRVSDGSGGVVRNHSRHATIVGIASSCRAVVVAVRLYLERIGTIIRIDSAVKRARCIASVG
jgi:hypothetical protein